MMKPRSLLGLFTVLCVACLSIACNSKPEPNTGKTPEKGTTEKAPPKAEAPPSQPSLAEEGEQLLDAMHGELRDLLLSGKSADEVIEGANGLQDKYLKLFYEIGKKRDALDEAAKKAFDKEWGLVAAKISQRYMTDQNYLAKQQEYAQQNREITTLIWKVIGVGSTVKTDNLRKNYPDAAAKLEAN